MNLISLWRLARYENGYAFKPEDVTGNGYPIIRIRQMVDESAEVDLSNANIPHRYLVCKGDLLFSWSGSLAVRMWDRRPGWLNQHLFKVIPSEGVNKRWLRWVLTASISEFQGMMHGSAMTHLNLDMLKQVKWPLPNPEEQRRIADFLDAETSRIDRVVDIRRRQGALLLSRRWSHFEGLIQSIEAPHLPLRRVIRTVIDGPFGSAFSSGDYVDRGAKVVRLGNIGFAEYCSEDEVFIPLDMYNKFRQYEVSAGDVLIAGLGDSRNHAGRACIAPDMGPSIVKGKCFRMRVEPEKADPRFISLLLSSPLGSAAFGSRGSTRSMINLDIVKSARLPMPALRDQLRIVDENDTAWGSSNALLNVYRRQSLVLGERRQALITAAVTGQFDVSTASGRNTTQGV